MVRSLTLTALTALALLSASPAPAEPAPAGTAVNGHYSISYRKAGTTRWKQFGDYDDPNLCEAVARKLYEKGYEVHIHTSATLPRPPERTRTGKLDEKQTVTPQKCADVFNWMARQTDIAFRYPTDGCYARAHLMILRMRKYGFHPAKVWSFQNGDPLYARTPNHPRGYVTWKYHVAPILRVRFHDGKQSWYVIDPSLFSKPVTIVAWRNAQKKPGSRYDPYITLTWPGAAPTDKNGRKLPGSGYWPGFDPREGPDTHALTTMRKYKPYEGKLPPKHLTSAPADAPRPPEWARPLLRLAALTRRDYALAA
jgi:hypothetical protein